MVMMRDGLADTDARDTVSARDISELLADAVVPAREGRALPVLQ
jgi:hypothetical protein